jgi:hypothetical protein
MGHLVIKVNPIIGQLEKYEKTSVLVMVTPRIKLMAHQALILKVPT